MIRIVQYVLGLLHKTGGTDNDKKKEQKSYCEKNSVERQHSNCKPQVQRYRIPHAVFIHVAV